MVLLAESRVKTVESISVIPSFFVTIHVNVPQFARILSLVTAESVQLKVAARSLTIYVNAGDLNIAVSIVKVANLQKCTTSRLLTSSSFKRSRLMVSSSLKAGLPAGTLPFTTI